MNHEDPVFAQIVDWTAVTAVVASLAGWLPPIATFLSIVWLAIRIWETKTVQDWVKGTKDQPPTKGASDD